MPDTPMQPPWARKDEPNPAPDMGVESSRPPDSQLTGGRGDNLETTVQEERVGTADPEPRNRMMAENQVDLDSKADTSSTVQGNKYGVTSTAAANFAQDFRNQADKKVKEAALLLDEADSWLVREQEARAQERLTAEQQAQAEEAKRRSEQQMERVAEQLEKLTERLAGPNSEDTREDEGAPV